MADDIADWFRSIPKITRWWFSLSVIIPLLARLGILNGYWLFLSFEHVVYHFQVSYTWVAIAIQSRAG